jgi:hypothetical protein
VVLHFDGNQWTEQPALGVGVLRAVTGTSASNVYAVGDAGVIVHYDGVAWSIVRAVGSGPPLNAVWVGGDDVIAVGDEIVGSVTSRITQAEPAVNADRVR